MTRPPSPASSAPTLQDLRAARGKPVSALRRYRGWLIALGVLFAVVLFGVFGAPPIAKIQLVKHLSERLGREVFVEKIRLNPLVCSFVIEGLAIAEADPQAGRFVEWQSLYVNVSAWSLLVGDVRLQEIKLMGFYARAKRTPNGEMNFDDIVARLRAANTRSSAEAEGNSNPRQAVAVGHLAVIDARIDFSDQSMERPFGTSLGPLTFSLTDFRTVGDPDAPYKFEAETAAGERLVWKGTISADPIKSQGELSLSNIDLAQLSPFYHTFLEAELRSAKLDASGRYTFELREGAPRVTWQEGSLRLRDIRLGAPGVATDAVAVRMVELRGVTADSAEPSAKITAVSIEGMRLNASRDQGGLDLARLLMPRLKATSTPAVASKPPESLNSPEKPQPVPHVTVAELSLGDVKLELTDLTPPRPAVHRIEDLRLTLRDLDSAALDRALPLALKITLPEAGQISIEGSASAVPLTAELKLTLEQVPLAQASPYLEPLANLRLTAGTLRGEGHATLREGAATFTGTLGLAGLGSVDGKRTEDLVTWKDLSISGIRASSAPLSLHADLIRLIEPTARVRIEADGTLHIARAGSAATPPERSPNANPPPKVANSSASPPPPLALSVGRVEVVGASLRYEDRSSRPAARAAFTSFSGSVSGLSSDALGRADVDIRGQVDDVAPVAITGKLNPLGTPAFVDIALDFKGIDLRPGAGPYIARFAGRELSRGKLSLVVQAQLKERNLDLQNVVTLDQFELGSPNASPDATTLPISLALALLRDTSGQIVLNVPVKGSLDDPDFRIGRVIARVLVNILTKATTSPFALLGSAASGLTGRSGEAEADSESLSWQDFAPGVSTLDPAGIEKLTTLAAALETRPELGFNIAGGYDAESDAGALKRARLEKEIRVQAWKADRFNDAALPPPEEFELSPALRAQVVARLYATVFANQLIGASPGGPSADGADAMNEENAAAAADGRWRSQTPLMPTPLKTLPTPPLGRSGNANPRRDFGRLTGVSNRNTPPPGLGVGTSGRQAARPRANSGPALPAVKTPEASTSQAAGAGSSDAITQFELPSVAEMESGLEERIALSDTALVALAQARAEAVRAWLTETGGIASERLTLVEGGEASGARVTLELKL